MACRTIASKSGPSTPQHRSPKTQTIDLEQVSKIKGLIVETYWQSTPQQSKPSQAKPRQAKPSKAKPSKRKARQHSTAQHSSQCTIILQPGQHIARLRSGFSSISSAQHTSAQLSKAHQSTAHHSTAEPKYVVALQKRTSY